MTRDKRVSTDLINQSVSRPMLINTCVTAVYRIMSTHMGLIPNDSHLADEITKWISLDDTIALKIFFLKCLQFYSFFTAVGALCDSVDNTINSGKDLMPSRRQALPD